MKFEVPELEIITFDEDDIIRTSGIVTDEDNIFGDGTNPINNVFTESLN